MRDTSDNAVREYAYRVSPNGGSLWVRRKDGWSSWYAVGMRQSEAEAIYIMLSGRIPELKSF